MFPGQGSFFLFVSLWTLVSLAFVIIVVMLIIRAVNYSQRLRSEAMMAMVQKGMYDPRLLEPQPAGTALLGWGIALVAVGVALMVGLLILHKTAALIGGLIPLFLGAGLIVTYVLVRRLAAGEKQVTRPVCFPNEHPHGETAEGQAGPPGSDSP